MFSAESKATSFSERDGRGGEVRSLRNEMKTEESLREMGLELETIVGN